MKKLNKKEIRHQLRDNSTSMKRSLGQNYLTSQMAINKVVGALDESDVLIEIGPGIGNLTRTIIHRFKRIILIELDDEKIPLLRENLKEANDGTYPEWVEIVNGDFLSIDLTQYITKGSYQVLGALPYNLSKKIITKTFGLYPTPISAIFILQKEVADKYLSHDNNNSFLWQSSSLFAKSRPINTIKKTEFYPVPKVDSKTIKFEQFSSKNQNQIEINQKISEFIKTMFANPRKKLSNSKLKLSFTGKCAQFSSLRPAQMTPDNWKILYYNEFSSSSN